DWSPGWPRLAARPWPFAWSPAVRAEVAAGAASPPDGGRTGPPPRGGARLASAHADPAGRHATAQTRRPVRPRGDGSDDSHGHVHRHGEERHPPAPGRAPADAARRDPLLEREAEPGILLAAGAHARGGPDMPRRRQRPALPRSQRLALAPLPGAGLA